MYNHNLIEKQWQTYWAKNKTNQFVDNKKQKKYYVLDMFPYPSGSGLHVGHIKGYTATDILARFKILQGYSVLHPMGWDAFGLPAEQYALSTGNHPEAFTKKNINVFRDQLKALGFNYDYAKEVNTIDSQYYQWTQWIFSQLFEKGLAEVKDIEVNWCEELGTVLANEEVLIVNGKMVSERGQHPVIKKPMRQWVLKITNYANKLLDGLNEIDWPESLKSIQRSWIGKSIGALVKFQTSNSKQIEVFTTRVDTIYGITFLSIAPEHSLLKQLTDSKQWPAVQKYIEQAKTKTDLQRKELQKDKTGIFIGTYAINPITNDKIPIYVADYVLNSYATGIVMGVPGHDQRDFDFAKKYHLPIKFIIETNDQSKANEADGKHIASPLINGLLNAPSQELLINYLEKNHLGKKHITFKLKDWIFSRQRYWGEPFPIVFDEYQKPHLVKDLPVLLPKMEKIELSKTGESPLANLTNWTKVKINGKVYRRETNTMPQWAGSCWYYLGYLMKLANGKYLPLNTKKTHELFKRWLPIDLYVGGQEHAVLHLLYARFWHRFLYDIGIVPTKEPFNLVVNPGMILGPGGEKMSKSLGNVVNPNDIIKTHGADALRCHEMFMGPLTASLPWAEEGLNGIRKWLDRVYLLFFDTKLKVTKIINKNLDISFHKFVKGITSDMQNYGFNVAISKMMIFINECYEWKKQCDGVNHPFTISLDQAKGFVIIFSCFAPHLGEEIWSKALHLKGSVALQKWPSYDEDKTIDTTITLPIQENGKLRTTILITHDLSEEQIMQIAYKNERVKQFLNNRQPKKIIYVKEKILNFIL